MEISSLDSYSKARKYYGLFSAILISWSMVGIDIESIQAVGSKVNFKNPEAIPYALIALVLYFSYRFSFEWALLGGSDKENKFVKTDYVISHLIGFVSVNSFLLFRALATSNPGETVLFVTSVAVTALFIGLQIPMAIENFKHSFKDRQYIFPVLSSVFAVIWFVAVVIKGNSSVYFLVIYLSLLAVGVLAGKAVHRYLIEAALNKARQ